MFARTNTLHTGSVTWLSHHRVVCTCRPRPGSAPGITPTPGPPWRRDLTNPLNSKRSSTFSADSARRRVYKSVDRIASTAVRSATAAMRCKARRTSGSITRRCSAFSRRNSFRSRLAGPQTMPLMLDRQRRIQVHRRLLRPECRWHSRVRWPPGAGRSQQPSFPTVLASSSVRDLGGYKLSRKPIGDPGAVQVRSRWRSGSSAPRRGVTGHTHYVIWAGTEDQPAAPRLAMQFIAESGQQGTICA